MGALANLHYNTEQDLWSCLTPETSGFVLQTFQFLDSGVGMFLHRIVRGKLEVLQTLTRDVLDEKLVLRDVCTRTPDPDFFKGMWSSSSSNTNNQPAKFIVFGPLKMICMTNWTTYNAVLTPSRISI